MGKIKFLCFKKGQRANPSIGSFIGEVETAATVHVDILKKLNCISYLQLIGADEDTKELSNPVYYMKTVEELPQVSDHITKPGVWNL